MLFWIGHWLGKITSLLSLLSWVGLSNLNRFTHGSFVAFATTQSVPFLAQKMALQFWLFAITDTLLHRPIKKQKKQSKERQNTEGLRIFIYLFFMRQTYLILSSAQCILFIFLYYDFRLHHFVLSIPSPTTCTVVFASTTFLDRWLSSFFSLCHHRLAEFAEPKNK